jgi:hypothetical protein
MLRVTCEPIRVDQTASGADRDLADLLNLPSVDSLIAGPTPHPTCGREVPPGAARPRVLFVGDSFLWTRTSIMDAQQVYLSRDVYYYFSRNFRWPEATVEDIDPEALDWDADVLTRDVVIVEVNEISLHQAGYGFVEAALRARDRSLRPPPREDRGHGAAEDP